VMQGRQNGRLALDKGMPHCRHHHKPAFPAHNS
jgi:hypothetical protein